MLRDLAVSGVDTVHILKKTNITTATFVFVVVVDPERYFISIRQLSLPVDFWYFATY